MMGWQEDEIERRRLATEARESEKNELLSFWNKILDANNKLPSELKANVKKDKNYTWLEGKATFCLILNPDRTEVHLGGFEARYLDGRGIYYLYNYTDPDDRDISRIDTETMNDDDIPILIKHLCTGECPILTKFIERKTTLRKPVQKSFISKLLGG